ncbi:hypothetical protein K439DRAFT_335892 [Ramaria rubella]|nr:hypothetical protein K439DRAFT_335892 [Ramaria rubella]
MGRDSRRAIAINAEGHELRIEDYVKEGRKGQVLHIHQSFFAFLYNREITENGSVFVTRARSLISLAPKNMLKPGGAPDLSKMNPPIGGAAPVGGFVGSGAMGRGPRDRLIGVNVVVVVGTFKGYIGIIKDTNGPQARVELNTENKVITIEKDKLKRPGKNGGPPQPLEAYSRNMGPPTSTFNGARTPNPYDFGSKTPAWGSSGWTPNPYGGAGGRTPAWNASARTPNPYDSGGKTPAWNVSTRTSNPYSDSGKTPAWIASSRTPNPYSGSSSWGGAASGPSGAGPSGNSGPGWGGATPARGWGGATPARAPNGWGSSGASAEDSWNDSSDNHAPYSAPTPGALGTPTPGASGAGAPTPGVYGASTPRTYSAPTPSFARTPGVAATPFVPGSVLDAISAPVFGMQPFSLFFPPAYPN